MIDQQAVQKGSAHGRRIVTPCARRNADMGSSKPGRWRHLRLLERWDAINRMKFVGHARRIANQQSEQSPGDGRRIQFR